MFIYKYECKLISHHQLIFAMLLFQKVGMPIHVHSRMQTNLIMHPTRYNSKIAAFNGITIPLFWSDMVSNLCSFAIDIQKFRFSMKIMKQIIYLSAFSNPLVLFYSLVAVC